MEADQPGLFDLPPNDASPGPERRQRGRNRQTWARTVTAEITIVDEEALHEGAERAAEGAVIVEVRGSEGVDDTPVGTPETPATRGAADALESLVWPTEGLDRLLEGDAFRIWSMDMETVSEPDGRHVLTWTVEVKLTDVHELRRLAAEARPDEAGAIGDSLAVAWQHAADPFAPLGPVPGITWRPLEVDVRHLPR